MRTTLFLLISITLLSLTVSAQTNDEVRAASGLPTPISGRASLNPQIGIDVVGSLFITGDGAPAEPPSFHVYVVAQNNIAFVYGRQKLKNRSSYRIEAVNATQATLVFEVGGREFVRYPLNLSSSQSVRQDISLTWSQLNDGIKRLGIVDARDYARTDKNQELFEKALEQKRSGKAKDAVSTLKKLLKDTPDDFAAQTELGNLFFESDSAAAGEAYGKALEARPDFLPALINLGKLQLTQKSLDESVTTLTKAVGTDSKSADAQYWLGVAYLSSRKGSKAVEHLNEALKLAPMEKADAHLRLAALYNAANLKDRAAAEYKAFLSKVPDYKDKAALEEYIKANGK